MSPPGARRRFLRWLLALCLLAVPAAPAAVAAPAAPATPAISAPAVSAAGAVLWDPADERALFERAADVPRPMASTTKVMTALLALEAGTVDDEVVVSPAAAAADDAPGAAGLGLSAGQRIPMRSLLAGLVVRSGNDAAVAVAEHVDGNEAAFVARMNSRARALGLGATAFVNASGLTDDPGHHATPVDLARLGARAMAQPEFAAWAGAGELVVPGLPPLRNRNELLGAYPGATGVKTGYTALAGWCLVASATRDKRTLFAVVLGSTDSVADAAALLDFGFTGFTRPTPVHAGRVAFYRWADTAVPVRADESLGRTVPADARVTWTVRLAPTARRPVAAGAPLGEAELVVDGLVVDAVDLRADRAVGPPPTDGPPAWLAGSALHDALRAFARAAPVQRPLAGQG
jgi:D-alanyl-D-alanine carboxypeptidase